MKRRAILLIIVGLIILAGLFVLLKPGNKAKEEEPKKLTSGIVDITNAEDYSTWLGEDLTEVEQTMYKRVKSYSTSPLAIYHGTIRADSLKTTHVEYKQADKPVDIPTVKYIVDIPDAKQSYFVSRSGGDEYPYNILYVLCVPKEQMIYDDFGCKDEF